MILLKDSSVWTQEEVKQVHGSDAYSSASSPRRNEAMTKVKGWYDQHYGTDPVQSDETGRTVEPGFSTVPQKNPVPAKGKDGLPVLDGVLAAGTKVADLAGKRGLSTAVLQDTINDVGANSFGKVTFKPLKADGWIGPKTASAFERVFKPTGMGGFMKSLGANFGFI